MCDSKDRDPQLILVGFVNIGNFERQDNDRFPICKFKGTFFFINCIKNTAWIFY